MKLIKKIKAFTVSEMSIVLLLTTIVVGLAFTVLGLVQKQMRIMQMNFNNTLELNKLETELWLDFNRYPSIRLNAFGDRLLLKNELDSVTYTFSESYLIKEQDTFPVQLESKNFYFDGQPVTTNSIDAIKLVTTNTFQNRELFIYVKNDATTYMNTKEFLIHKTQ